VSTLPIANCRLPIGTESTGFSIYRSLRRVQWLINGTTSIGNRQLAIDNKT